MKTGIELITKERQRQIDVEEWTSEHDDEYINGELASAGACYAMPRKEREKYQSVSFIKGSVGALKVWYPRWWPWKVFWWKPTPDDRIRELTKAGALILAEIDRLQRIKAIK